MSADFQARPIVDRFDKLLLLRLIQACETLISESTELTEATGFSDLWAAAKGIAPQGLARVSQHPLAHAWVSTTETLLKHGIHTRYPLAHPTRHLKDFSRLVLSWATHLPDGVSGRLSVPGRRATQLAFGDFVLCREDVVDTHTFIWSREGGVIRIGPAGQPVMECGVDFKEIQVLSPGWALLKNPRVGQIRIDVWTSEYLRNCPEVLIRPELIERSIEAVLLELDPQLRSLIESACRCVSPDSPDSTWTSGLLRMPREGMNAALLMELVCRDLIQRLMILNAIDQLVGAESAGSDFHSVFVELAARRLAYRLLKQETAPFDQEEQETWGALRDILRQSETGTALLSELGEEPGNPTISRQNGPRNSVLHLPIPTEFFSDLPANLTLRKTRRGSAFSIDDFSAIDALSKFSPADVEQLWRLLSKDLSQPGEVTTFLIAITAYILGRFDCSAGAFLRCLDFDADVEEYWHLLAFTLRHLKHYAEFDQVMFTNLRSPDLLQQLSKYKTFFGPREL